MGRLHWLKGCRGAVQNDRS
ncbi:hypothetical protein RDI58_008606 [Solanum bulbocastanum]|uniref:Uncharacterized protein n=1 Tax=Solanum bulbocastanum TaxID=147425 RepID=A0AAN8TVB9_SOLBU